MNRQTVYNYYRSFPVDGIITETDLDSYHATVDLIRRWAGEFSDDTKGLGGSFWDAYLYIRDLPYVNDPRGIEHVSRPGVILNPDWDGPRDCDDKTLALLAFCHRRGISARPVVVGQVPHPHHIYPEVLWSGRWISADPTFSHRNTFGRKLYDEQYRDERP